MRTELSWVMTSLFSPERLHSKKSWVVSTQIWVKYGPTQMLG